MDCILNVLCHSTPTSPLLQGIPSSPAPRTARPFSDLSRITSLEFLKEACPDANANTDNILHSSFGGTTLEDVMPQRNGFVHTVLECCNECHALTIRPEDIWIAIITQFRCFLNGNADALQSLFVLRDGEEGLSLDICQGGREDLDLVVQTLLKVMKEQMQNNLVDPEFMQWMIPAFSNTIPTDELVSGIVMMGTVKQYSTVTHQRGLLCGIPRVTLEGQKDDWSNILNRIEKLKEFGPKTTAWYWLLCPILSRFVDTFQESNSAENLEFWSKVAYSERSGSDERQLSGWITAFMVFDEKGRWKGDYNSDLILDGITYPHLDGAEILAGYAQVGVALQREIGGPKHMTSLIAGSIGSRILSSDDKTLSDTGKRDSARPALGWWWLLKKGTEPQDSSTLAPSDKFPWRFIDANAFLSSGVIRIVSFEDIGDLDFVAISYVWTDGIKKWRNWISSRCSSTYEERIGQGSGMLSTSTEPADISDGDSIAHAHLFFTIVAFFVLTRGKQFFWIDILCINQDEQREKSFFVPLMGDLYRRAAETHAYPFGGKIPPSLISDEIYFPIWETRAWTVQEQILSKRVLFCYALQGDVRQDLRNIRGNAGESDPECLVDIRVPVLDRYRYADGIFLLETKGNTITCKMEEESWGALPTSVWVSEGDGSALMRQERSVMSRGFVQESTYKVLYATKESRLSNTAEAARICMFRIATERRSTIPEDMIYSVLGALDLGNFSVEYKIGFEEARLRVFEALSPKIFAHIIGTEWGSKPSANNKDSALPRVVGSSPVSCITSLKSAIHYCKYTRNVGTWMNCRREELRVWAPDARIKSNQDFLRITLGNDRLLLMQIASIFDIPEVASMPTKMIPRDLTKVIIVEMSTFGVNSDDEASKIDRTAKFVEIGMCHTGGMIVPSLPETMGKSSLLALYCENTTSGTLVNKGTVLILDASAFSTEYGDTLIE